MSAALRRRPQLWTGPEAERAWLAEFAAAIPCEECRQHWNEIVTANPPDLSSPEAYHAWGVARHDEVNRKLGLKETVL